MLRKLTPRSSRSRGSVRGDGASVPPCFLCVKRIQGLPRLWTEVTLTYPAAACAPESRQTIFQHRCEVVEGVSECCFVMSFARDLSHDGPHCSIKLRLTVDGKKMAKARVSLFELHQAVGNREFVDVRQDMECDFANVTLSLVFSHHNLANVYAKPRSLRPADVSPKRQDNNQQQQQEQPDSDQSKSQLQPKSNGNGASPADNEDIDKVQAQPLPQRPQRPRVGVLRAEVADCFFDATGTHVLYLVRAQIPKKQSAGATSGVVDISFAVIGDEGVGKSSLWGAYQGLERDGVKVDASTTLLPSVNETAADVAALRALPSPPAGVIAVYDVSNYHSFTTACHVLRTILESDATTTVLLVGNKADLYPRHNEDKAVFVGVDREEAEERAKGLGVLHLCVSAKEAGSVGVVFEVACLDAHQRMRHKHRSLLQPACSHHSLSFAFRRFDEFETLRTQLEAWHAKPLAAVHARANAGAHEAKPFAVFPSNSTWMDRTALANRVRALTEWLNDAVSLVRSAHQPSCVVAFLNAAAHPHVVKHRITAEVMTVTVDACGCVRVVPGIRTRPPSSPQISNKTITLRHDMRNLGTPAGHNSVLLVGGYDEKHATQNAVFWFHPGTGQRVSLPPLPSARANAAAALVGKVLVVAGGSDANASATCSVMCLEVEGVHAKGEWINLAWMSNARSGAACAVANGSLYVIGGWDGYQCLASVEKLNYATRRWEAVASMHSARKEHACVVVDGLIYAVSGYNGDSPVAGVERYDPATDTWEVVCEMAAAASAVCAVASGSRIFVAGGCNGEDTLSSLSCFDPYSGRWTAQPAMSTPRSSACCAVLSDALWVLGGHDGDEELACVECFAFGAREWEDGDFALPWALCGAAVCPVFVTPEQAKSPPAVLPEVANSLPISNPAVKVASLVFRDLEVAALQATWKRNPALVGHVKVQWFRCPDALSRHVIEGATSPVYLPTAYDFGCWLEVNLTPVMKNGSTGAAAVVRERVFPDPELQTLVESMTKNSFAVFEVVLCKGMRSAELTIESSVQIRAGMFNVVAECPAKPERVRFGIAPHHPLLLHCYMDGEQFDMLVRSPVERDVVVLTLAKLLEKAANSSSRGNGVV